MPMPMPMPTTTPISSSAKRAAPECLAKQDDGNDCGQSLVAGPLFLTTHNMHLSTSRCKDLQSRVESINHPDADNNHDTHL
jgi:hypothetical protein